MKNLIKLFIFILVFEVSIFSQMKWEEVNSPFWGTVNRVVNVDDTIMLAGMKSGKIYLSLNSGANWNQILNGEDTDSLPDIEDMIYMKDRIIIASVNKQGLLRTNDHGVHWETIFPFTGQLLKIDSNVVLFVANTSSSGLYISNDKGATWNEIHSPGGYPAKLALGSDKSTIFGIFGTSFYSSVDTAKTWILKGEAVPLGIKSFVQAPNGFLFAINNKSAFKSINGGSTWTLDQPVVPKPKLEYISMIGDSTIGVANLNGLSSKHMHGNHWSPVANSGKISPYHFSFSPDNSVLLLADKYGVVKYQNSTFTNISTGITRNFIINAVVTGDTILCFTETGLYISIDNGEKWHLIPDAPTISFYWSVLDPPYVFIANSNTVYRSSNMGVTWSVILSGKRITEFSSGFNHRIFLAIFWDNGGGPPMYSGLQYSDDFGSTWNNSTIGTLYPNIMSVKKSVDGKIYAAFGTYLYPNLARENKISISSNNGAIFDAGVKTADDIIEALYSTGKNGYFLSDGDKLFYQRVNDTIYSTVSTNIYFRDIKEGRDQIIYYSKAGNEDNSTRVSYIPRTSFISYSIDSYFEGGLKSKFFEDGLGNLYICSKSTIYRAIYDPTDVKEVTQTEEVKKQQPIMFFPNPFSIQGNLDIHSTEIQNAKIEMYNILGQKVLTVFEGELEIGTNSFDIDGNKLTSGIYIIRVQTPKEINTLKVILRR